MCLVFDNYSMRYGCSAFTRLVTKQVSRACLQDTQNKMAEETKGSGSKVFQTKTQESLITLYNLVPPVV